MILSASASAPTPFAVTSRAIELVNVLTDRRVTPLLQVLEARMEAIELRHANMQYAARCGWTAPADLGARLQSQQRLLAQVNTSLGVSDAGLPPD